MSDLSDSQHQFTRKVFLLLPGLVELIHFSLIQLSLYYSRPNSRTHRQTGCQISRVCLLQENKLLTQAITNTGRTGGRNRLQSVVSEQQGVQESSDQIQGENNGIQTNGSGVQNMFSLKQQATAGENAD